MKLELARVVFLKLLKLVFQQNVIHSPVSKDKRYIGRVIVLEYGLNNLIAWRDSSAASNATNLCFAREPLFGDLEVAVAFVLQAAFRAFHLHGVTDA